LHFRRPQPPGRQAAAETDPFLLLDDFRNDRPQDYLAGWHPHRGIETIKLGGR
jgi:redox-sensitive bicupin YhaK (pirin superfamily)